MNLTRIEQLLKFLKEDPNDAFSLYALALEYKQANPEEASQLFKQLLSAHPDYLPAYYQSASLLQEIGKTVEALQLYDSGIELAINQNDLATLRELKAARQLILDYEQE
jgi:tetratricopeptide (TPR) repeat protein